MTPILSTTLVTFNLIIFLSFLSTRVDNAIKWNWFLVFIPIFFLNICFIFDSIILLIRNRKSNRFKLLFFILCLISILLVFAFEILLCLKLEYLPNLSSYYVFAPIWSFFFILLIYFVIKLKRD